MGESRAVLSLAAILSFRMLGLFMIYPVFAVYAPYFHYANASLIGIALGIYGLTQALLQLPLSMLSDRIGRKPVIVSGLLVFALGSILCACTSNIYVLIIGRALQGTGAIGSTLMAYCADVTRIENRTKAMAVLGMTIGLSFALAMVLGPLINAQFHLSGIFWLTALLALLGIAIQYLFVPTATIKSYHHIQEPPLKILKMLLQQKNLLKLNISILLLHMILTASFAVIPLLFTQLGVASSEQWKFYLPALFGAFIATLPFLIISEKKNFIKFSLLIGILMVGIAEFLFYSYASMTIGIIIALFVFFTGFTLLEAILPAQISKIAPTQHKGSAMGIYSSFQFCGIFLGGAIAGIIRNYDSDGLIFNSCILLCTIWFFYLFFMIPTKSLEHPV